MIMVLLAVMGGLGAAARFLLDTAITRHSRMSLPIGTFVVNLSACFLLGLFTGWALTHPGHDGLYAVLGVGFLGGYSTFSAASVEAARLLLAGRGWLAIAHPALMLLGCLSAAIGGILIGRS